MHDRTVCPRSKGRRLSYPSLKRGASTLCGSQCSGAQVLLLGLVEFLQSSFVRERGGAAAILGLLTLLTPVVLLPVYGHKMRQVQGTLG